MYFHDCKLIKIVKTWVAVNLIDCRQNVVIPMKYVYTLCRWAAYNRRINRNQIYQIFYSQNMDKDPNFFLDLRQDFTATVDACYRAQPLKCFGEFHLLVQLWLS